MWVQVHRFVPAESSATWSRPCCGACSRQTPSARAGCDSTRPRSGRDRWRSACASAIGGGSNGSAIGARDVRVKRHPLGRPSLEQRSSASGPVCRVWACISWRMGSTTRGPLTWWWPSSRRPERSRSTRLRTMTWPCDLTASRRCVTVFRPAFLLPSVASSTAPSVRRARLRSPRGSVAAIKAPP